LQKEALESDLADFMLEFARYLVAAGITDAQMVRVMRQALFSAASASARFSNSRLNQSAVAAMTGLTRVQVRALAKTNRAIRQRSDYLERVVAGWTSDPDFTSPNYVPRKLSTGGKHAAFNRLVHRYGGDVPSRSILREMIRNELVTARGKYVQLNPRIRQTRAQVRLQQLTRVLSLLLKNPTSSVRSTLISRPLVMEVTYPSSSPKGRALIQRKSHDALRAFLSELHASGVAASIETPPRSTQATPVTRTRILVMTDGLDR
jgi:hypothetical protein